MDRKLCTACKKEGVEARKKGEGCPPSGEEKGSQDGNESPSQTGTVNHAPTLGLLPREWLPHFQSREAEFCCMRKGTLRFKDGANRWYTNGTPKCID